MMKWIMIVAVAGLLAAAPAARAHCGTCGKGEAKAEGACKKSEGACKKGSCDKWTDGLSLTDEQKAKITEIKAGCDGSKESCTKAKDSIRALLTAEQQKAFDEKCAASCEKPKACCAKEKPAEKT